MAGSPGNREQPHPADPPREFVDVVYRTDTHLLSVTLQLHWARVDNVVANLAASSPAAVAWIREVPP